MKYIFIYILFIFSLSVNGANTILKTSLSGKIIDKETGESIIGATVYVPDMKTGAVTDTSGVFKIDNLPKAKILVQISYLGYKTIVSNLDLSISTSFNFELEQSVAEMNAVVVTGSSRASEIKRSPVPIISIDCKTITQNLNTNIIDAIAKLPGINAVTTGPNVSKPFIHGMGYNRVLTLYDGVRQEGQQWGDEHGIEVDENSVDKIEVIKGPASLIYGSDALAGVVNLLPSITVPNGVFKGNVTTNYQSNNGMFEGSASLAGNNNGFVWGGRMSHKEATNYQNKVDGRVYGTAFNENNLSGYIGLNRQWGYSHLNFSVFDDLQEIPDGSRDSSSRKFTKQTTDTDTSIRPIVSNAELNSYKIAVLHQHVQHYKVYSSNNIIIGSGKLGITLGYQQNVRREFSHPQYPDLPGLYLVLNTFTYDVKYYLPEMNGWETTIGLNGMYQTNTNNGTEFIIPNYKQFDIGPFAFIKKSFEKLDISAGLRYDTRFFKNDEMYTRPNPQTGFDMQINYPDTFGHPFYNYKHTFSGVSGSIGIAYNVTDKIIISKKVEKIVFFYDDKSFSVFMPEN